MNCRRLHRNRAEATDCIYYRSHQEERIGRLHGPNEFTWQLDLQQDAIMGGLVPFDPWPVGVKEVFALIQPLFGGSPEEFAKTIFGLRDIGLIWVDCDSGTIGYTAEGREHTQLELAERGGSLQQLRLATQAEAPSTYEFGPHTLYERVTACIADHDFIQSAKLYGTETGRVQ